MAVELSIVIVNWNGVDFLRECLRSVSRWPPRVAFDVIVVDNASVDASVEWLRSGEAQAWLGAAKLHVIENSENLGFSKANNQAFAFSRAPLQFLLNSDAEVREGAIDKLVETIRSGERIGAVGPRVLNPDGTLQPTVWRNPPVWWEILLGGLKLYKLLPQGLRGELLLGNHWDHLRRRKVMRLNGAAVLVRREVIDDVGGLDERFHMYGEDVEWCLRMARAGWTLLFEPEALVMHHGGQSSMKRWGGLETERRIVDGQLRFQQYCLSRGRLISNILASSVVASTAHVWRRARGYPTAETGMVLGLYAKYLKEALRDK